MNVIIHIYINCHFTITPHIHTYIHTHSTNFQILKLSTFEPSTCTAHLRKRNGLSFQSMTAEHGRTQINCYLPQISAPYSKHSITNCQRGLHSSCNRQSRWLMELIKSKRAYKHTSSNINLQN